MRRVDASRIVAGVAHEHPVIDGTATKLIGKAVSEYVSTGAIAHTPDADVSVAAGICFAAQCFCALPFPAIEARLIRHSPPKACFQ